MGKKRRALKRLKKFGKKFASKFASVRKKSESSPPTHISPAWRQRWAKQKEAEEGLIDESPSEEKKETVVAERPEPKKVTEVKKPATKKPAAKKPRKTTTRKPRKTATRKPRKAAPKKTTNPKTT